MSRKKGRRSKRTPPKAHVSTTDKPLSSNVFKKYWTIFLGIFAVIGFIALFLPQPLTNIFKSKNITYNEENFIPGILLPDEVTSLDKNVIIRCKNIDLGFGIDKLIGGAQYKPNLFVCQYDGVVEYPINIKFKLTNNRLVISANFKDINGNYLGSIEENQLKLFKPNILNWYISPDNKAFEVLDRGNHVVLQLSFEYPNIINLQGYFVGNHLISVFSDGMYLCYRINDAKDKASAMDAIDKITHISH